MPNRSAYLAYIYLLRVPALTWLVLVGLVAAGLSGQSLVRGLFDLAPETPDGWVLFLRFALLAFAALLASVGIVIPSWLVLVWGDVRFDAGKTQRTKELRVVLAIFALAPAAAVVGAALWITKTNTREGWSWLAALGGGTLGFGLGLSLYWLARWVRSRVNWVLAPLLVLAVAQVIRLVFRLFGPVWGFAVFIVYLLLGYGGVEFTRIAKRGVQLGVRTLATGYVDAAGELDKGHLMATAMMTISFIAYAAIGQFRYQGFGEPGAGPVHSQFGASSPLPTLAMVVLWLMLACYVLAGMAYFLDYFRIPLLLVVGGYALFVAQSPEGDHFYHVRPKERPQQLAPGEVLRKTLDGKGNPGHAAILVSATGGGIQAAGWTAQALAGIAEAVEAKFPGQFAPMVRLVSSVSGGSVGALYFISAYHDGALPNDLQDGKPAMDRVVDAAEASSLDQVAFGLIYTDQWRALFPFGWQHAGLLDYDRGRWLENAWKRDLWPGKPYHAVLPNYLSDWRTDVRAGKRPAVIFNSTFAETGERFLMGTSDLVCPDWTEKPGGGFGATCGPDPAHPVIQGTRQFYDEYDKVDLHPATAARLSATFPIVTAAARIDQGGCCAKQFHAVDGGYYDNYGMATLAEWLAEALRDPGQVDRVLVIQLRSSPPDARPTPEGLKGWFFQMVSPLLALYEVRGTTQLARNGEELYLLEQGSQQGSRQGSQQGSQQGSKVAIRSVVFSYNGDGNTGSPPLSWHLTQAEKENIRNAWQRPENQAAVGEVLRFVECAGNPGSETCRSSN